MVVKLCTILFSWNHRDVSVPLRGNGRETLDFEYVWGRVFKVSVPLRGNGRETMTNSEVNMTSSHVSFRPLAG